MKKMITLLAALLMVISGFAQNAKVTGDKAGLEKALNSGYVEFTMPAEITSEKIEESAQYYTDYFKVKYEGSSNLAHIDFVEGLEGSNLDMARRVVTRFLLSTGVRNVEFQGENYSIMKFYTEFMAVE